jgi:serine/threonine protein kinase
MKFLRGRTLAEILRGLRNNEPEFVEKFDLQRMMRVYVKVCNAIAFAHSKDIIHLDIKPENIHVGDFGEVLVLDWGLAKYIGETEETYTPKAATPVEVPANEDKDFLTLDGVAKGTPGYMAPEQAAGENSKRDKRSDIYALGAILYSILTQQKPVQGNDVKKIMADTIQGNIVSPRKAAAETDSRYIPSALEAIAMKAMSVNPDDRYQTVRELREDIFAFMGGFAPKAEAASSLKKTVLFINRNSFKIYFAIAMILLLALIGTVLYMYFAGLLVFEISGD